MYIRFDLGCNEETQKKIHPILRHKIKKWKELSLVNRAVLTYHFPYPYVQRESLYLCLDIPTVQEPIEAEVTVSRETQRQIPSVIMQWVNDLCQENPIELAIINWKFNMKKRKKSKEQRGLSYYNGAPVKEILRFASVGTEIAPEILEKLEENEKPWSQDTELSKFICSRLRNEFGADYRWMKWALHFVCNPLMIPEYYVTFPHGNRALKHIKSDP